MLIYGLIKIETDSHVLYLSTYSEVPILIVQNLNVLKDYNLKKELG